MRTKPCRVCESPLEPFHASGEDRLYHTCPACEWILLDEVHHLPAEKQKARYLLHENSQANPGYVKMFERFMDSCVDPFARKGGTALDFGCGPEPVLAGLLRERGYHAEAYDPLFFPDESYRGKKYDLICLTEVLEHLSEPMKVLWELKERLTERGSLAVMTLFHPKDEEKFSKWWYRRDATHVSFYTERTIGKIAEGLGMSLLFTDSERLAVLGKGQ
jgi:hypothetical protein